MTESNTRRQNPPIGNIVETIAAVPFLLYVILDLSVTPFGQAFEIILFCAITISTSCLVCTVYDFDCASNIRAAAPDRSQDGTMVLGVIMTLGGLAFILGWILIWHAEGNTPLGIAYGILYAEELPVDFVFGSIGIIVGTYLFLAGRYHDRHRGDEDVDESEPDYAP